MRDSVPSVRYSSVCNVLHLWTLDFLVILYWDPGGPFCYKKKWGPLVKKGSQSVLVSSQNGERCSSIIS